MAASTRDAPPVAAVARPVSAPLPRTVAERRAAQLRAAALATIPVMLFLVAAVPRVWAPDLAPFGPREAAHVAEASRRAADSWLQFYGDPTVSALGMFEPLLRNLPSPVATWVALRGLLDALGVALLYRALRPSVGALNAVMVAALYAASPVAWAAARDPAGSLGPLVGAATLLAAVRLVDRPTLARGAVFGVALGLLARTIPLGLLVVALGAVTLASARASRGTGVMTALGLVVAAGPALFVPSALLMLSAGADGLFGLPRAVLTDAALLLMLVGCSAFALRRARLGVPVAFAVTWIVAGLLGVEWARGSSPTIVTHGADVQALVISIAQHRLLLALALLLTALSVAPAPAARWCGWIAMLSLVGLVAAATLIAMRLDEDAEWDRPAFEIGAHRADSGNVRPAGLLAASPSLREATALTDAMRESAARAGVREVVLLDAHLQAPLSPFPYGRLLGDLRVRSLGANMTLPLEREAVYLVSAHDPATSVAPRAIEARRPSSVAGVFTPNGADTSVRIFTIRPRPVGDWLARVSAVSDGRFADGSVLLGIGREVRADGTLSLVLYWHLPAAADGRALGVRAEVMIGGAAASPGGANLPPVAARRGGELALQSVPLTEPLADARVRGISVALYDDRGALIRTSAGDAALTLPSGP